MKELLVNSSFTSTLMLIPKGKSKSQSVRVVSELHTRSCQLDQITGVSSCRNRRLALGLGTAGAHLGLLWPATTRLHIKTSLSRAQHGCFRDVTKRYSVPRNLSMWSKRACQPSCTAVRLVCSKPSTSKANPSLEVGQQCSSIHYPDLHPSPYIQTVENLHLTEVANWAFQWSSSW